jgi:hypothetical protein
MTTYIDRDARALDEVCSAAGCRKDHRGDTAYEAARRAFLLERARARRAKAA